MTGSCVFLLSGTCHPCAGRLLRYTDFAPRRRKALHISIARVEIERSQVLAALDVHTAKWIVEKCFRGDLVRGRTVILVVRVIKARLPLDI